jgi:hypothetical protein
LVGGRAQPESSLGREPGVDAAYAHAPEAAEDLAETCPAPARRRLVGMRIMRAIVNFYRIMQGIEKERKHRAMREL